ncbi:hypothetical protein [Marinobacter salicampi]|uniref:hypothetical protein n=1 Tax=Marinobacter salicampi TaxID=435907 RepID=UPI001F5FEAB3|nr:hypothetical protein [Marinobacter salicampi]
MICRSEGAHSRAYFPEAFPAFKPEQARDSDYSMPLSIQQARAVGELLCTTTTDVLWAPSRNRIHQVRPGATLACRVGSGQATYHRHDQRDQVHRITYGLRMVMAKYQSQTAAGWLSSREIIRFRYFDGILSPRNLLAHTCVHEFAHLLQQVAGQRRHGSVHNQEFYRILHELHADGSADAVKEALGMAADRLGLSLPETAFVVPEPTDMRARWRVGDAVSFGSRSRVHSGTVQKVNSKTCTVTVSQGKQGLRYRVPFALLRREGHTTLDPITLNPITLK